MLLEVTVISEHGDEHIPSAFKLGATRVEVREIIDRWLAKDHSYFKVEGDDHAIYILRHDKVAQKWELTLFRRDTTGQ